MAVFTVSLEAFGATAIRQKGYTKRETRLPRKSALVSGRH
jgi:hypothetical protein